MIVQLFCCNFIYNEHFPFLDYFSELLTLGGRNCTHKSVICSVLCLEELKNSVPQPLWACHWKPHSKHSRSHEPDRRSGLLCLFTSSTDSSWYITRKECCNSASCVCGSLSMHGYGKGSFWHCFLSYKTVTNLFNIWNQAVFTWSNWKRSITQRHKTFVNSGYAYQDYKADCLPIFRKDDAVRCRLSKLLARWTDVVQAVVLTGAKCDWNVYQGVNGNEAVNVVNHDDNNVRIYCLYLNAFSKSCLYE